MCRAATAAAAGVTDRVATGLPGFQQRFQFADVPSRILLAEVTDQVGLALLLSIARFPKAVTQGGQAATAGPRQLRGGKPTVAAARRRHQFGSGELSRLPPVGTPYLETEAEPHAARSDGLRAARPWARVLREPSPDTSPHSSAGAGGRHQPAGGIVVVEPTDTTSQWTFRATCTWPSGPSGH